MNAPASARRIAGNAASAYAARAVLALNLLVLTPFLFRKLGPGGFGTWSVIFTIGSVFALGEAGFGRGLTKVVAELHARGERRALDECVGTSVSLLGVVGLVALAGSAAIALGASGLAAEGHRSQFELGMLVLGFERFVAFPLAAYGAVLGGYQRYDLVNAVNGLQNLAFPLSAIAVVSAGGGVLGVTICWSAVHLAASLLSLILLGRTDAKLSRRPRFSRAARKRLASFASFVFLAESMTFIGQRMDTVVIASLRNAAAAGPYAAVLKLQTAVQSLTLPFVYLLMPMASDLWARAHRAELVRGLGLATRACLQITLPVAVGLAVFAPDIVHLWLGANAPDTAVRILIVLMAVQIAMLTAAPAEQFLIGVGRARTVGLLGLLEGVSNLTVSIVLVSRYGAVGAAVGTLVTSAVIAPIKIPLAARVLETPVKALLSRVGSAIAISLPALAVILLVRVSLDEGPVRLVVGLGGGLLTGLAAAIVEVGPRQVRSYAVRLRTAEPEQTQLLASEET